MKQKHNYKYRFLFTFHHGKYVHVFTDWLHSSMQNEQHPSEVNCEVQRPEVGSQFEISGCMQKRIWLTVQT